MPDKKKEDQEQKESKERADYDGMWKDAIERFLPRPFRACSARLVC